MVVTVVDSLTLKSALDVFLTITFSNNFLTPGTNYINMKSSIIKFSFIITLMFFISACGSKTDVVESGTYRGSVDEVEPEKTEIYVVTDDNKRLELYFTDQTTLTRQGETVQFDALQEGQQVEVTVEKVGQRLDPVSVNILE